MVELTFQDHNPTNPRNGRMNNDNTSAVGFRSVSSNNNNHSIGGSSTLAGLSAPLTNESTLPQPTFGASFEQEKDASGVPLISSRRRRNLNIQNLPFQMDVSAHTSRLVSIHVNPGVADAGASVKTLRKWGGFVDRSKAWALALFGDDKADRKEDRTRYWSKLKSLYDSCQGCELNLCSHVFCCGAGFLTYDDDLDDENVSAIWDKEVFSRHEVKDLEQKNAIKRILMALEDEYDFDYAPQLIDLVCLLSLHLTEVQTYAAVRRLIVISSSTFLKMPRRRSGATPRRLLSTSYVAQMSLHAMFLQILKSFDLALYRALSSKSSHIQHWFERLLIPILPMDRVVAMIDCLIAGDDVKLMFRACYRAIQLSRASLLRAFKNGPAEFDPTEIIRSEMTSFVAARGSKHALLLASRFAKRRMLIPLESSLSLKDFGKMPIKRSVPHVCREAFQNSTTVLTFGAASRLVKMIPPHYRHTCSRMRSVFKSEIGPMGLSNLSELYAACQKEKSCSFIMLIAAKVPNAENDLNDEQFNATHRTDSTSFSHPLMEVSNYVVFGVFSPTPLVQTYARASSTLAVTSTETVGDENTFVFRLAPSHASKKWTNKTDSDSRLVMCMAKSLMVGKVTRAITSTSIEQKEADLDAIENSVEQDPVVPEVVTSDIGPALLLSHNLQHGCSSYSETFGNEPLCVTPAEGIEYEADPSTKGKHYYFNVFAVEIFALPKV